jgi:flagellar hook assembly protein FlgD
MEVAMLESNTQNTGLNSIIWDGTDASGKRLKSGVYFYRIKYRNGQSQIRKMILLD